MESLEHRKTAHPVLLAFSIGAVMRLVSHASTLASRLEHPDVREIVLAHIPITAIPVQALDAHRGGFLARVQELALTLAGEGPWVVSRCSFHCARAVPRTL